MLTVCNLEGVSISQYPDPPLQCLHSWMSQIKCVWERTLTLPLWESFCKTSDSGLRSYAVLPNPQGVGKAQTIGVSIVFKSGSLGIRQMGWFKSKISHSAAVSVMLTSSLYVPLPAFIKGRPYYLLIGLCEMERDNVCDALVTECVMLMECSFPFQAFCWCTDVRFSFRRQGISPSPAPNNEYFHLDGFTACLKGQKEEHIPHTLIHSFVIQ